MEKLFYDQVVSVLRQKLGPAQAGYVYTCEYHLLTLLEIAADRIARGLTLLVLLGDLIGAFPKVWRALLVILAARPGQLGASSRYSREVVGAARGAEGGEDLGAEEWAEEERPDLALTGSRLVLFKELLEHSSVEVTAARSSVVQKMEGLGEGGMLGPLEYPLVPAVLSGALEKSGVGIGVAPPVEAPAE